MFRSGAPFIVPDDTNEAQDSFLWTADVELVYFPFIH
jgi:hypothetical protein